MFPSMYMVSGSDSENYLSWLGWYCPVFYDIIYLTISLGTQARVCKSQHLPDKESVLLTFRGKKPILTEGFYPLLIEVYLQNRTVNFHNTD